MVRSSQLDVLDEKEGIGSPIAQSTLLHALIVGLILGYGYMHNLLHGGEWGANVSQQGAIQATLVSTAALPLPQDRPPTDNVLATETPSEAPIIEEQKTEPLPLPEAIPIPEKKTPVKPEAKKPGRLLRRHTRRLQNRTKRIMEKPRRPTFHAPRRATTAPIAWLRWSAETSAHASAGMSM